MNISPFIQALENRLNEYKTKMGYTYFDSYSVLATEGKKFFKVYKAEIKSGTQNQRNLVCFIDKATGDIFKPASFSAPAKHARGNVLSPQNGMEAIDSDGFVIYLRY
jgi:hypothetical protein